MYKMQKSIFIDANDMKIPPFDTHRLGKSNELLHVFLWLLDGEIKDVVVINNYYFVSR